MFVSNSPKVGVFIFLLSLFLPALVNSCDLTPNDPNTPCLDLVATALVSTENSQFGRYIEGCSVSPQGQIFAVNYGEPNNANTIGQVYPEQRPFYSDVLTNSKLNGVRFLNANKAFAVDANNHRVLQLDVQVQGNTSTVVGSSVFCENSTMLQPNDLTLSKTGTVFTSGMRWLETTDDKDGDIWSCTPDGRVQQLELLGRTNGIDLSPDETLLYVSESYNQNGSPYAQKIFVYDANVTSGTISNKRLFADFVAIDNSGHVDIDGVKTDVNGNLFVTRHNGRSVVVFTSSGQIIAKIGLSFPQPTNLEFGGVNGTTLFVVGKCENSERGCVDMIEFASPGRSWSNLQ